MQLKHQIVILGMLTAALLLVVPSYAQDCYGDPDCYDSPASVNENEAPPWEGLSDGRLNPDMAEYYSVWCINSEVRVLRAVPPPTALVDAIPIQEIAELSDSGVLTRDTGLTIVRSGDTITLSGNNGNLAPQPGSKSFSREQCLNRIVLEVVEQEMAEIEQQNLQYCSENFDPDSCPEDDILPFHLAWQCTGELLGFLQPTGECERFEDSFIVGSAIAWIIILGMGNCGASGAAVVLAPGSLGYFQWRRTRKRKQINRSTTQKEQ